MVKKSGDDVKSSNKEKKTKKDDIPDWVSEDIQNAKFQKPEELKRTGYILEIYDSDNKIDVQFYDPLEDGRHIATLDSIKKIKISELERGVVYEFSFDQYKAPLDKKVIDYLQKEKEIEMNAIYRFELKGIELLDVGSSDSVEAEIEE